MTRSGSLIVILISALGAGCVIIPTKEYVTGPTRGRIEQETLASIRDGATTREEVLVRLGEPDVVMRNERLFAYHWVTSTGYLFVAPVPGGPYGGGGGGYEGPLWQTRYLALVEFDEQGIVKRHEVKEDAVVGKYYGRLSHGWFYAIEGWLDDLERW